MFGGVCGANGNTAARDEGRAPRRVKRATPADLRHAQTAVDRLSADPTEPGVVLNEIALLRGRAQLARAHGDANAFERIVREYRGKATAYGFEGHLAMANVMASPQNGGGS
jgi:adenylate cyclase